MRTLVPLAIVGSLALTLCGNHAFAQDTRLDPEQQAWIEALAQDPDRVDRLMQMEADRTLMEGWDAVTTVRANEFHIAAGLDGKNSTGAIATSAVNTKVYAWVSVATPRHATVPIEIQFIWYHESVPDTPYRIETVRITSPSPAWRTRDEKTLRKSGTWTVEARHDGNLLGTTHVEVR